MLKLPYTYYEYFVYGQTKSHRKHVEIKHTNITVKVINSTLLLLLLLLLHMEFYMALTN